MFLSLADLPVHRRMLHTSCQFSNVSLCAGFLFENTLVLCFAFSFFVFEEFPFATVKRAAMPEQGRSPFSFTEYFIDELNWLKVIKCVNFFKFLFGLFKERFLIPAAVELMLYKARLPLWDGGFIRFREVKNKKNPTQPNLLLNVVQCLIIWFSFNSQ